MSSVKDKWNPIDRVICQINFPATLMIGEKIADIQQMIKDQYPFYVLAPVAKTSDGMPLPKTHVFSSMERDWDFTLTVSSLLFVCYRYRGWNDFIDHVMFITTRLNDMFDLKLTVRVGLRYINAIRPSMVSGGKVPILNEKFAAIMPEGNTSFEINMANDWNGIKSKSTIARIIFNDSSEQGVVVDIDVFSDVQSSFLTAIDSISALHQKSRELFGKYVSEELKVEAGFNE